MIPKLKGHVGPPGSGVKYKLEGDSHTLIILLAKPRDEESDIFLVIVQYPDGYHRHHEVKDVDGLLGQVAQQLKGRYNLKSFTFTKVPKELKDGEEIVTGENVHDA